MMIINWKEDKEALVVFTLMVLGIVLLMYKSYAYVPYDAPSLRCHDESVIEARVIPTSFNENIAQRVVTPRSNYTIYTNTSFDSVTEVCKDKNNVTTISSLDGKKWLVR